MPAIFYLLIFFAGFVLGYTFNLARKKLNNRQKAAHPLAFEKEDNSPQKQLERLINYGFKPPENTAKH